MFGKYTSARTVNTTDDLSWMDIGNAQPNGKVAAAIFRLLAPGGHFCNLVEAVSVPPKDFSTRLKKSWKGDSGVETEAVSRNCCFDMPLSTLYSSSYELLGESTEANWYTLSRSRCPSMLLIPFWNPPLVTRFETDHEQVLTSLPCFPLPYFVLRMLLYVTRKAQQSGTGMVRLPRLDTLCKKIGALRSYLMEFLRTPVCVELPLYHRLLTAYIQYFVSSAFAERLSSRRSLEDVQWSTSDVTASLLLSAPGFLWMKSNRQVELEIHRTSCGDVVSAALVFRLVPFLTECFLPFYQNEQDKPSTHNSKFSIMLRKEFSIDSLALSAWDTLYPAISFYRNTLIALRQALISLDKFVDCRREHFNNSLELWCAIIKPNRREEGIRETYVLHHYEAYSFILMDVFTMILKSSFLTCIDLTGATMLARCLEVFSAVTVQSVIREVSNTDSHTRSNIVETICQHFVLNWTGEDGAVHVLKLFGTESLDVAAEVYIWIESRLEKSDLEPMVGSLLKKSLVYLMTSFDGLSAVVETRRCTRSFSIEPSDSGRALSAPVMKTQNLNTEEERQLYFRGIRRSCSFSGPLGLQFATENNSIPGGHYPVSTVVCDNEFPFLLIVTRIMDMLLEKLLEMYYSAWIPTCSRGHRMWLLSSNNFNCMNHPQQSAIWECSLCEEVYGSCCRSCPYAKDGKKLFRAESHNSFSVSFCGECCALFQSDTVVYSSTRSEVHLCSICASRPFKRPSCRFLASYTVWAVFFLISLIAVFIYNV
ncbi:hypothetical protein DQ04_01981080 [Trypanosoma grayi]|uniref:hypothetical protein n=1 Tax=Trypanosoma grayi TaxID=71804 RepID=UPI0004F4AB60|nr:hypothetical protein DQ04_01981080 [Trypanosoma grayi]KEG12127.1 hypothetical protein DQ04_01981080 [Trypanosoma grayi]